MQNPNDLNSLGYRELLVRFRSGSTPARDVLGTRLWQQLYPLALRLVDSDQERASDLFQEAFKRFLERQSKFDPADDSHVANSLARIILLVNIEIDRKGRRTPKSLPDDFEAAEVEPEFDIASFRVAFAKIVVLAQLTPEEVELLRMRYDDGLTVREIAERRDKTPAAVTMAFGRLHQRLRVHFEAGGWTATG